MIWYIILPFLFHSKEVQYDISQSQNACDISRVTPQKSWYDFLSDNSLYKFVSPVVWLNDARYKPEDLVTLEPSITLKVNNHKGLLRQQASLALSDLASAFYAVFNKPLVIISSYRGYDYQQNLLSWYIHTMWLARASTLSALPGHSEHQLWLAVDVFDASTNAAFTSGYGSYVKWLQQHAYQYWWTQSYQKGRETDWYVIEPWHWRYIGKDLATYLWENKMTFGEYVKMKQLWVPAWIAGANDVIE